MRTLTWYEWDTLPDVLWNPLHRAFIPKQAVWYIRRPFRKVSVH